MTSSELSDALNPYASHPRSRPALQNCLDSCQQNVLNVQDYTPHRSELELAIPEAQLPPVDFPQPQIVPPPVNRPPAAMARPVQELLRTLHAAKEAQERETQRRIAWEREQEVKYRQRQIEMEQQINEMRQEITALQSALARNAATGLSGSPGMSLNAGGMSPSCSPSMSNSSPATGLFTPQYSTSPVVSPSRHQQPNHPMSPLSLIPPNPPSYNNSHFVQDSSATSHMPIMTQPYYPPGVAGDYQMHQATIQIQHHSPRSQQHQVQQFLEPQGHSVSLQHNFQHQASAITLQRPAVSLHAPQSVTSSPSPLIGSTDISHSPSSSHSPPMSYRGSRKRTNAEISTSDSGSSSDSSDPNPRHRIRRVSHHDKRCLTVHHAMRAHFLRMMQIETDKELPDSHVEGEHLGPDDPVRFVWDKTTKQSVHNSRMKTRIMEDIRETTQLYKYVPKKDFMKKKVLEAVFEQCFVTFRQKFRAQRDALTAQTLKKREDTKARRARRVSRRKIKLSNRAESREKIQALEHVTFDGALQLECMSSEESDYDTDASGNGTSTLRTRGYAWRSQRLIRFYNILDIEAPNKLKRGVGKKERQTGPLKEGFHLPPKGVASWMISKRWMKAAQQEHHDLPNILRKLIEEPAGFEWRRLDILGEGSEDDSDPRPSPSSQARPQANIQHPHPHQSLQQHHPTGFQLQQSTSINYNSQPNLSIPQQHYNISSLDYALS